MSDSSRATMFAWVYEPLDKFEAHAVDVDARRSYFTMKGTIFEFRIAACGEAVCTTIAVPVRSGHHYVCKACSSQASVFAKEVNQCV